MPSDVLTEFEDMEEGKRLERIAEVEIIAMLRATGFDRASTAWRDLAEALVEYGYAVLVAWAVTGELASRVAAHGGVSRVRVPTVLRLDEDDARGLAADLLMVSIENFRTKSLVAWDPASGASLKTFFVGRCLLDFADVYQRWYRRERRQPQAEVCLVDDGRHSARPDVEAEARVLTDDLLKGSPSLRRAFEMQADGYSLSEIAKELGTTEPSVRSQIYRSRQRLTRPEDADE